MLKTRFGDGYRSTGQLVSYWTDGIMGTADDRFGQAVNNPEWNFRVSGTEALAARVLKNSEPELANRSLMIAEEDWKYAVEGLKTAPPSPKSTVHRTNWNEFRSALSRQSSSTRQLEMNNTLRKRSLWATWCWLPRSALCSPGQFP